MNMNWRKKKDPIQKRGFCGDLLNLITYVGEEIVVDEQCTGAGTGASTGTGTGAGAGTGAGGLIGGENNGAGLIGANTDLTITINNDSAITFTQKTDSNSNFIHIMENVNNDDYQGRFGIFTPVPSVNTIDYSLTIYDNNRNVIVHADKISVTTPQQKQYGYQITPTTTKNNGNTFNVYQTETCTITIAYTK